jgi:hypothetical protein
MRVEPAGRGSAAIAVGIGIVVLFSAFGDVRAATAANSRSPLGLNLTAVNYFSAEQPFLDVFKTSGISASNQSEGWITHTAGTWDTREEAYLQLDRNGFPTSLTAAATEPGKPQQFQQVCTLLLRNLPPANAGRGMPYRAGNYTVLYDGQGALSYGFDAVLSHSSPGRDVVTVATPTWEGGFLLCITSTDPRHTGNNLRNIRVVYSKEESLLEAGQTFRPGFLQLLQNFRVLRFMDWGRTNNNSISSWSKRSQLTDGGYGTAAGVPWEIDLGLANASGTDPWLDIPAEADNDYITQFATLAHRSLNTSSGIYVELSNEVWNASFSQYQYSARKGRELWPAAGAYQAATDWYGMRTAQMCDIWKAVWGNDFSRVHCVLGAQTENPYTATQALDCPLWVGSGNAPCSKHHISEVAICWYFSFAVPASWGTLTRAQQLDQLFSELNHGGLIPGDYPGGYLKQAADFEKAYALALKPYDLPFISYEGGQGFSGAFASSQYPEGSWAVELYIAANRDPRMRDAYLSALTAWRANGGRTATQYADISAPNHWGEWGALESFGDTTSPLTSSPPKWEGLQRFISGSPCWWAGCAGTVGSDAGPQMHEKAQ